MSKFWDKFNPVNSFEGNVFEGGCSTCGHGAEKGMDYESFKALLQEIDAWIEQEYGGKK